MQELYIVRLFASGALGSQPECSDNFVQHLNTCHEHR